MLARRLLLAALALLFASSPGVAREALTWQPWSPDVFARAKAENRFVLLDLEAVWCHWCHVMEETTYRDAKVVALLKEKYITVRVDQDANPDLASRYGDWGWPATIVFAADGSEIVKRRGYIAPNVMVSLLEAIIADPSPGPSVIAEDEISPSQTPLLAADARAELEKRSRESYDLEYGGWGSVHKFIDPDSMDWELTLAERGDTDAKRRVLQTLDAALGLIDRVDGGIFQYSDQIDWKSPHYEKIMSFQSSGLRQYSAAYQLTKEPRYLTAARDIERYLLNSLRSPEGAFYTSQDADAGSDMTGKVYYAMTAEARRRLGRQPRIDTNMYARENGWAIRALAAFHAATGDREALSAAETAANWVVANRAIGGGGFRHSAVDRGGPFLGDTLAMGQAALELYAATGERKWLEAAAAAGDFIAATFKDASGGFRTAAQGEAGLGVFKTVSRPLDEQVEVTRFANRLHRYFGRQTYRDLAEHGGRYLTSPRFFDRRRPLPGVLVADAELAREPTHITIVGRKDDPRSGLLHAAARTYPAIYKRVDWWDKREGPLPNPDVQYPELERPAAFACSDRICSLPAFEADELRDIVAGMRKIGRESRSGE